MSDIYDEMWTKAEMLERDKGSSMMEYPGGEYACVGDYMAMVIGQLRAERDNLLKINKILRDRPDLEDRARKMDALIKQNQEMKEVLSKVYHHVSMVGFMDRMTEFCELLRKMRKLIDVQAG